MHHCNRKLQYLRCGGHYETMHRTNMTKRNDAPNPRRDAGRPRGAPIVDAVLSATLHALACDGLAALSVDSIAVAAGVNKTSVYRRWPTRDLLVVAALERVLENATAQMPDTGSLESDLVTLLQPVCGLLESPLGSALLHAATIHSNASPIQKIARKQLRRGAPSARKMFTRAIERGEATAACDPRALLGMLVGAILHRVLLEREAASERWLRGILSQALRGVTPRS
jgi:AcrR family transcriptional regulator